ncbi:MAG TPA: hypothetical protein VF698_21510, partial [Thermoanaerobaculia bacterium]
MSTTTEVTVRHGDGAWTPVLRARDEGRATHDVRIDEWHRDDFDFWAFDRRLDDRIGARFSVIVAGERSRIEAASVQIVTRCQRLLDHRNAASRGERFDRVLAAHRALHDL